MTNTDAAKPLGSAKSPLPSHQQHQTGQARKDEAAPLTGQSISDAAREQAHDLKDAAGELAQEARGKAGEFVEAIKDKAREVAEEQKARGSEQIDGVARTIRDVADELGKQMPAAAGYVRDAAQGVENFSSSLRDRSVDDLIGSVYRFARSQPVAFFGASVLAGFALSRFLKSSGEQSISHGTHEFDTHRNTSRPRSSMDSSEARSSMSSPSVAGSMTGGVASNRTTQDRGSF